MSHSSEFQFSTVLLDSSFRLEKNTLKKIRFKEGQPVECRDAEYQIGRLYEEIVDHERTYKLIIRVDKIRDQVLLTMVDPVKLDEFIRDYHDS